MHHRRLGPLLPVVVAVALLASGCHFSKAKSFPSTSPSTDSSSPTYVALGDSYSTGGLIGTATGGRCLRSEHGYPTLLAAKLGVTATFEDDTCGGATTSDLTAQSTDLSKATTLVTLGVGTNDDGFATQIGYTCLKTKGKVAAECDTYLATPAGDLEVTVGNLATRLQNAIEAIKAAAPNATVVLVGYPQTLPVGGTCPKLYPLDDRAAARLTTALKDVNTAWSGVAKQTGALYIDTYAASADHTICSADPWINGVKPVKGDGAALHPNAAYHRAVAAMIEKALPASAS